MKPLCCLVFGVLASWSAFAQSPEWRIVQTKYPTADVVVVGLDVTDFGADKTGKRDSTRAFQNALNRMRDAGGGTVFAPEGRYLFEGSLEIPVSVTLRGEWKKPTIEDPSVGGTILMPTAGAGNADGTPFITVEFCAGVKDLNVWYPEQTLPDPTPYPYCMIQKRGNNATFENLTLVNPYQGIKIGPGPNELHLVRDVFGTPLKNGVWYDSTTDIGRLQTISFTPFWWSNSGLPDTPKDFSWIRQNGTAMHMGRSDWEYVADVYVEGYYLGYFVAEGEKGAANAQFYRLILRQCEIGMEVEKTNPFGMVFTQCFFDGTSQGVLVDEPFNSTIMFSNCMFSGGEAIRTNGKGKILMENCQILSGNLTIEAGVFSALDPVFKSDASRLMLADSVEKVVLAGDQSLNWGSLVDGKSGKLETSNDRLQLKQLPVFSRDPQRPCYPGKAQLSVVEPIDGDCTQVIQNAMDQMARRGGGIVFLPAGDYELKGQLNVPSGVELRGVHDVPHHSVGGGSVLHVYKSSDEPTVTLAARSGLRGLGFNYPTQDIKNVQEFPYLIQGRGSDLYIINVNAVNPYRFIDLMTHRCDRHYIDYPSGGPLMSGIVIGGGSEDGLLMNLQFNPHYWGRTPKTSYYANRTEGGIKGGETGTIFWEFQKENLDALVIGNSKRQFLFQNFVYGSLYGIHFTEQDGEGAVECLSHGHGTDGSKIGAYFEHGHGTITMINSELVAMSSENKTAIVVGDNFDSEVTLINTMIWGQPDILAEVRNGTLTLQNMHANRHGEGLKLTGGKLLGYNLSFNQKLSSHLQVSPGAKAELTSVVTNGEFGAKGAEAKIEHVTERGRR
ncbi:MAG: glycosyl hydrolase family 28-related protein [Verrucomicrobiota bacterium]